MCWLNQTYNCYLQEPDMRSRGHLRQLAKDQFKRNKRKYLLTQWVVNLWRLPTQELVEADSISMFKKGLDKLMGLYAKRMRQEHTL